MAEQQTSTGSDPWEEHGPLRLVLDVLSVPFPAERRARRALLRLGAGRSVVLRGLSLLVALAGWLGYVAAIALYLAVCVPLVVSVAALFALLAPVLALVGIAHAGRRAMGRSHPPVATVAAPAAALVEPAGKVA